MQYKLNYSDVVFLIDALHDDGLLAKLKDAKNSGTYFEKGKYDTGRYVLTFTKAEIDIIEDLLSDFFMNFGLDEGGEKNAQGLQAEALIDVFANDDN